MSGKRATLLVLRSNARGAAQVTKTVGGRSGDAGWWSVDSPRTHVMSVLV